MDAGISGNGGDVQVSFLCIVDGWMDGWMGMVGKSVTRD